MTREEALKILGLEADAPAEVIKYTANKLKADLQSKLASAPTDAVKDKFQQFLDKVIAAEQCLNQSAVSEPSPATSHSSLSETKMADLPGMAPNSGSGDTPSAQSLQAGIVLAQRYEIKEQIGSGGMGAVYRATDSNTGKDIALKVLLPELTKHERARERFLDEARISQQLSHPNIVNVYDVQQDGDYYFLTMELLGGQDLRQVMENRKLARSVFSIDEVQEIIGEICEGLTYAHKYTVHRDIKPENIWLSEQGEYKIMDFGIARVQSTSQRTQTGAAMGTAYYMAPEQLKGQSNIDGRADQYALAVLAYELLSGEVPAGMIEPIQQHRKDVPKAMANAIHQALAPRPENRFEDAQSFNEAVGAKSARVSMPSLPALPAITPVTLAGIVFAILLIAVLGSSGSLSDLLPKSSGEIAAEKAAAIKLQGKIKTLSRRLESSQRDLKQNVKDAQRNKDKNLWKYKSWQNLVDNHIFESTRYSDLQGLEALAESQLRDKEYLQAEITLKQIDLGYQELLGLFETAEKLPVKSEQAKKVKKKWLNYIAKGYGDKSAGVTADKHMTKAGNQRSQGLLKKAHESYYQSIVSYNKINHLAQAKLDKANSRARAKRDAEAKAKAKRDADARDRAQRKADEAAEIKRLALRPYKCKMKYEVADCEDDCKPSCSTNSCWKDKCRYKNCSGRSNKYKKVTLYPQKVNDSFDDLATKACSSYDQYSCSIKQNRCERVES